jgi:hypothetical protein
VTFVPVATVARAYRSGNGGNTHETVTARDPSNTKLVAMIRGEGFAGLLTEGDHHARHHMALARGDAMARMH